MGSCFSDNFGQRLNHNKFDTLTNPFGVIFNPISINKLLKTSATNSTLDSQNWVESQRINLHYDLHSQLGSVDQKEATENINRVIKSASNQLKKTKWLIITWGTALVYERKDTGDVVANCHKVSMDQFTKRLLSYEEIVTDFEAMTAVLPQGINILLTVSPVRHLKETLELNSVSKSILRVACHHLAEKHSHVSYFPAYELILDDLRDYRFYNSDMLHPSDEAINYVWDKFIPAYFDESTLGFIHKWSKISAAINHKPFNPQSEAHQQFIRQTINSINELKTSVDVFKEISHLEQQLIK